MVRKYFVRKGKLKLNTHMNKKCYRRFFFLRLYLSVCMFNVLTYNKNEYPLFKEITKKNSIKIVSKEVIQ